MVHRRYFFHVSGFDPYDSAAQYRRFVREAARFATTWKVATSVAAMHKEVDAASWRVTTRAPGWEVETTYEILDWSDIVRGELARPRARRIWHAAVTLADLFVSGTAWRYFAANWRYGMFFLVPFLDVILFAAAGIAAGWFAGWAVMRAVEHILAPAAVPVVIAGIVGVAIAVAVFDVLMRWPGDRWRISQGLADWIFARDYMLGRHPAMAARIEAFAARVVACAQRADTDEIIVTGHSLGATVALDVLGRAFERDPALGRHGAKLCLLTVGATIPKLALHPRGEWLRERARRLAAEPSLAWAEYQARDDIISFHKFDPVRLTKFKDVNDAGGPVIRRVQIHQMLGKETLRRIRFDYMRLHYQFVMANELRTPYDYFMLMCGPAPFTRTVNAPNGPDDLYAADGSLRAAAEPS